MKIIVETKYDFPAMKALARGLRKTVRKKHSRRSHFIGWAVVILGILLLLSGSEWNNRSAVTAIAVVAIFLVLCFEDALNGWIALRRGIPGLHSSVAEFTSEDYSSKTEIGESRFSYENIRMIAETKTYFILVIGPNHGQVYSKKGISDGTEQELRCLLEAKTGRSMEQV